MKDMKGRRRFGREEFNSRHKEISEGKAVAYNVLKRDTRSGFTTFYRYFNAIYVSSHGKRSFVEFVRNVTGSDWQ